MLLFAGLGNPGAKYANNRHNVGFMAADAIARRHSFSPWSKKFKAEIAEGTIGGDKVLLLKPQSHIRQARQQAPAVKLPETGPMAAMLKKLLGKSGD